jgi:hypothetical protein
MTQQFAPPDYIDDIGTVMQFLGGLQTVAKNAGDAQQNTTAAAQALMNYVIGSSPTSTDGFDGILAALKSSWSGDAADAFFAQAEKVRTFGIGVAALMDNQTNVTVYGSQTPQQDQYHLTAGIDYGATTGDLQQILSDTHNKYAAATDPSSGRNFDHWTRYIIALIRNTAESQVARSNTSRRPVSNTATTVNVANFEEWVHGPATDSAGQPTGSATLQVSTNSNGPFAPPSSQVSYRNPRQWDPQQPSGFDMGITWEYWRWQVGDKDNENQNRVRDAAMGPERNTYLRKLVIDLGQQYQQVYAPLSQDASGLPGGTGQPGQQGQNPPYPGGLGGVGPYANGSPYGAGSYQPATGTAGYNPGSYNPSAYNPGGTNAGLPGAYNPGGTNAGLPGAVNPGAWDPSRLAGFNPTGAGGGLGTTGFGAGSGLSGGAGGFGTGAGGAGLGGGPGGAAGSAAGAPGTAGRAMPMAPMAGAGVGKDKEGRQRSVWLTEDEDVWGTDGEDGSAVL